MDLYIRKILRVSVAQICQTIGYNSIQSIPLELLIDSLHKFLQEFARDLHRHVELFNRTEANLDDVALSLESLNIKVGDLLEYINNVQPVGCGVEIPKLPASKSSNLNFLKPGSKEVLTRPVHIYEHLPPILRDTADVDDKSNIAIISSSPSSCNVNATASYNGSNASENVEDIKLTLHQITELNDASSNGGTVAVDNNSSTNPCLDIKRKPALDPALAVPSSATREISSVMMTSGGFISPAIEGRMPEGLIPDVVEKYFGLDAPTPVAPPVTTATQVLTPAGKTANPSQSPITNQAQSSASLRTSIKNDNANAPPTGGPKISPSVEKKLLKKVKKKSMTAVQPPNISGLTPPVVNDKAQRKRIKMLQKSMAKNTSNGNNATYKTKNVNAMTPAAQDKYLKKQYKLKQKQMRLQFVQKHMEVAINASLNLPNNDKVQSENASSSGEAINSHKPPKKDCFVVPPAPIPEETPASEFDILNSYLPNYPSAASSSSKGLYHHHHHHHSLPASQEALANPPAIQITPSPPKYDEIKLSTEPDRSKLNIFKKISSSQRKERADVTAMPTTPSIQLSANTEAATPGTSSANTTIFGDDQVISLPSGTTITPAPPSGSGRHVYAPPPSGPSGDFDSVISVDDDGSIPESSAVLLQRGDLMIHKPKKRGRKPGSKNQPKIVGLNTKKAKKMKKSFFGHHSNSNLIEPLNLSHSSIANIANIPLGIASTFPIDSEAALKLKKDRKKVKMGKDANFIRNSGKTPSNSRNLAPTKEEFASINQKLMMMDTVLQAAPPLSTSTHSPSTVRTGRSNSPNSLGVPGSFVVDQEPPIKVKKERKKTKQVKEHKQSQQGAHPGNNQATSKSATIMGRKSPSPYTPPNFPNVPGIGGMPMFPFYPFPARPGLIPSHNLFSQLPNLQNNALFMPQLMGFPPIRCSLKDEKELTPPLLLQPGEGNYSKVAPLVPDTMKLELSPSGGLTPTSSLAGVGGSKHKAPAITSTMSTKMRTSPSGQSFTSEPNIATSTAGNALNFGDFRRKVDDHIVSSSSGSNINMLKSFEGTIEVSSDDSVPGEVSNKLHLTQRASLPSGVVSSTSGLHRQLHISNEYPLTNDVNIVGDSDTSPTERRNKEHKKLKKLGKQGKKQCTASDFKNPRLDQSGSGGGFDENASSIQMDASSESDKKNNESANSSGHTAFDYGISPERRKDHKKMKKLLKEGKLKKKKDKKEKNKDRSEKMVKSEKSEKRKEEKKDKDKLKKLKKEKKKEKLRSDMDVKYTSSGEGTGSATEVPSVVPKLTLKLGQSSQSPTPLDATESRKAGLKATLSAIGGGGKPVGSTISTGREQSPELARISPLVTRPPKQKSALDDNLSCSSTGGNTSSAAGTPSGTGQTSSASHQTPSLSASLNILSDSVIDIDSNSGGPTTSMLPASATILGLGMNTTSTSLPPNSSAIGASSTSTVTAPLAIQSNVVGQHNHYQAANHHLTANKHSTAVPLISEANRPSSYIDAEGNRVWICPACGKVDDGSAMIGCDGCDAWYHWVCVGIFVAPNDNEDWYCRVCIAKKRGMHGGDRKRKRSKKKNINS